MLLAKDEYLKMRDAGVSQEDAIQGLEHVIRDVLQKIAPRERPWQDECGACDDTGWEVRRCYPDTANNCGRRTEHGEHEYVSLCSCRPSNRTFHRHHQEREVA